MDSIKKTRSFREQLPHNLIGNFCWFLANLIIGLLLVPYFINTLGVAAYGLIPLATSITGYVAIVVDSLNTSVSRYLTVDLQRRDFAAANRTFNTSLFGLSAIILFMVPIVFIISWCIPTFFNVPTGQEKEAFYLFLSILIAFLIRSWSGIFTVQLFALNRLDLKNLVNIINLVTQTVLIVIFFTVFGPGLACVGVAYLIGAIIASIISIILAKKICPELKTSLSSFDRSHVTNICSMGGWVIINQIGSLLFLQIDLIVVNLIFKAASAGEYAIALQWVILLRGIAAMLSTVLTPIVLSYYALEKTDSLIQISKSAVKVLGLAMALPIGLVCGFAPELLTLWVGPQFSILAPLMIILTAHLAVNLAVLPIFSINVAYNKVRIPGIVTLIMGIGNFILAIVLSLYTGLGYYSVAIAGAIVLTLKNAFFTPWYATRILNIHSHTFTRYIVPGIVSTIFIGILSACLTVLFSIETVVSLAIAGSVVSLVYLTSVWICGLSMTERTLFSNHMPEKIRRFMNEIPCYCTNR